MTRRATWTATLVITLFSACGSGQRRVPPALTRCDALPPARPESLVVERTRRGREPESAETVVLVVRGMPCPALSAHEANIDEMIVAQPSAGRPTAQSGEAAEGGGRPSGGEATNMIGARRACFALDATDMDALYRRLAALGLERVSARRVEGASPHRGGASVRITWSGGACEVADLLDFSVSDESRPRLEGALSAIDEAVTTASPALASCVAEDSEPPMLRSFADATPGTRHRVSVAWDEGSSEWVPSPLPSMPHHHASRMEWENVESYAAVLEASRGHVLVLTVTIVDRAIDSGRTDPRGARVFRATYRARIESVCSP